MSVMVIKISLGWVVVLSSSSTSSKDMFAWRYVQKLEGVLDKHFKVFVILDRGRDYCEEINEVFVRYRTSLSSCLLML